MSDLHDRFRAAQATAESIFWRPQSSPAAMFRDLAAYAEEHEVEWDRYGERGAVAQLEGRGRRAARQARRGDVPQRGDGPAGDAAGVVRPLGLAPGRAARPVPPRSTTSRTARAGCSASSSSTLTTGRETPTAGALAKVGGRLGAAMVELPLRDAGCLLPTWDELVELSAAARERGVPLHADGARIWESVPHWGRTLAEAADLFDSMYVSLYKGLGGSSGALVVCPEDLAGELRAWRPADGRHDLLDDDRRRRRADGAARAPDAVRRLPRVGDRPRRRAPRARHPHLPRGAAHRDLPGVRPGQRRRGQRAGRRLHRGARDRAVRAVARRRGAGLGRDRADLLRIGARPRPGRGGRR